MTTIGANRCVDEMAVHSIPCTVAHNGPAPVSTYFRPGDAAAANDAAANEAMSEAHFRGRKLEGRTVQVRRDGPSPTAATPSLATDTIILTRSHTNATITTNHATIT